LVGVFLLLECMITPSFLKPDDVVAIVAPARKANEDLLHNAILTISSWGLTVQKGKHLETNEHTYLAASDEHRMLDFQSALDDDQIRAIICFRGGYGTTRILDALDFSSFLKNPKWIVGFSDITALHLKLQKLGVQSIHSTMPVLFNRSDSSQSVESLRRVLFGESPSIIFSGSRDNREGSVTGEVVGGNLSLLTDSLGTSTEVNTDNKILVIEEVDEYLYKLDRMLTHLKRAGKLTKIQGMVVGHLTDVRDSELSFGETAQQIILHHAPAGIPVAFGFPSGHENPNLAWISGGVASLRVSHQQSSLTFHRLP
jgi:muramoyltetrapeptide carboxypeptidase